MMTPNIQLLQAAALLLLRLLPRLDVLGLCETQRDEYATSPVKVMSQQMVDSLQMMCNCTFSYLVNMTCACHTYAYSKTTIITL